jgi:hypothetical protein
LDPGSRTKPRISGWAGGAAAVCWPAPITTALNSNRNAVNVKRAVFINGLPEYSDKIVGFIVHLRNVWKPTGTG